MILSQVVLLVGEYLHWDLLLLNARREGTPIPGDLLFLVASGSVASCPVVSALGLVLRSAAVRCVPCSRAALLGGGGLYGFPIAGSNWSIRGRRREVRYMSSVPDLQNKLVWLRTDFSHLRSARVIDMAYLKTQLQCNITTIYNNDTYDIQALLLFRISAAFSAYLHC